MALLIFLIAPSLASAERITLPLSGEWRFSTSGPKPGSTQQALPALEFTNTIRLPGTTDTNKKGPENQERWTGGLTRLHKWIGPAWYERDITIPESFRGKRTVLFLERTKYTQVWLDGKPRGESPILCTPQEYPLGMLEPGHHRLTLMIDNSRKPMNVEAHQTSDNTQGNWNGIIGRVELIASDLVWIDDIQTHPEPARNRMRVLVKLGNFSGTAGAGALDVVVKGGGYAQNRSRIAVNWNPREGDAEIELPLTDSARRWDEFHPALHTLTVKLHSENANDERSITFGLREFTTRDGQFAINGRTTFLRGKHDACVFPLTGHPPMDIDGWLKYLGTCRDYGINHIRCHTWVPPEAAFAAADQLGMYIEAELPFWGSYSEDVKRVMMPEAVRILKWYGNHPSFVMLSLGNELAGSREIMGTTVKDLRARDPRRLYTEGSNNYFWDPQLQESDDFWPTVRTRVNGVVYNVRGSFATADGGNGHIQIGPPCTTNNYGSSIAGLKIPVVGHEIAQFTVYPDFREIAKYTGVFRARNFEAFRDKLAAAGMLEQSDDFFRASGKLAALCYREEVEAALRTPGFGGFQLLDLQDFPGQGTALVGILNAFMENKGAISADKWRQFCAPIVPLACFDRYVWTARDTFSADIKVAHYGEKDLTSTIEWSLVDARGHRVGAGKLPSCLLKQGGLRDAGRIEVPLAGIASASALTLTVRISGVGINSYPIWVYPDAIDNTVPAGVVLARAFDAEARAALAQGKRVVLIPKSGTLSRTVGGGFATDFWCWPMFHNKPGTMGILCDPKHPALAGFPTDDHSDWQWFHLLANSQPVILDNRELEPMVQVIDNLDRNQKLGLIYEGKVGPGSLLVCATDLIGNASRPEARQLLRSLLDYAASDKFTPRRELELDALRKTLAASLPVKSASASTSQSDQYAPWRAVDHDLSTRWCAADSSPRQWLQADLGEAQEISGCHITWESNHSGYAYVIKGSLDGTTWTTLSDQRKNDFKAGHEFEFPAAKARFVRIVISGLPAGQWASILEFAIMGVD